MNLFELITEYGVVTTSMKEKQSLLKRLVYYPFKLSNLDIDIYDRIATLDVFEILKEFRSTYLGLFGKRKTYNPLIDIYEFNNYNCLRIYIKYKYIINFCYNEDEIFIAVSGNYPECNKTLTEIPKDLEYEIKDFITQDIGGLLRYLRN